MKMITPEQTKLVVEAQPYMKALAFKMKKSYPVFLFEDLHGYANLGLMKAVYKFDESRDVKFKTFCYKYAWGAMMDHVRKELFTSRVKSQSFSRRSASEFNDEVFDNTDQMNPSFDGPHEASIKNTVRTMILKKILELPPQRRRIFYLEYYKEMEIKDIAKLLKVSPGALYSNKSFAMEKLRECDVCKEANELMGGL